MKTIYLIAAIALMLVPLASASYTIDPETKGWAVQNIADESYTIKVTNTEEQSVVILEVTPQTFQYIENVSVFKPLPTEFLQYITITPQTITLSAHETFDFKVHISFPDVPEMYAHTWEFHILFNDTNKYNYEDGGLDNTQKTAIVRLYIPLTKPVAVAEVPFYVYPFVIIFSLIFLGGMIIYLKKRAVPLAMKDHAVTGSEWAGMEVGSVPTMQPEIPKKTIFKKKSPLAVDTKTQVPSEIMAFVQDPTKDLLMRSPMNATPVLKRSPVIRDMIHPKRSPEIKKQNSLKMNAIDGDVKAKARSHQKKIPMET